MANRPRVYLVDGSSYVYRAFYAIRQPLSTSQGLPTKAVFGFKNMLERLLRQEQPHYLAVAFDERGPTFRHTADPKSHPECAAHDGDVAMVPREGDRFACLEPRRHVTSNANPGQTFPPDAY